MSDRRETTPPGYYDDGRGQLRWWDGAAWTQQVKSVAPPPYQPPTPPAFQPSAAAEQRGEAGPSREVPLSQTTASSAPRRGASVTGALVLAVLALLLGLIPVLGFLTWTLALAAVIVAVIALSTHTPRRGAAVFALVIGAIGVFSGPIESGTFVASMPAAPSAGVAPAGAVSNAPKPVRTAATLAVMGVPKVVHDGAASAVITLERVRWLPPQNGADAATLAAEFKITANGAKPFHADPLVSAWQYGTARDVNEGNLSTQLWRSPEPGLDETGIGKMLLTTAVKPGRTIDGWVLYGLGDKTAPIILAWDRASNADELADWPLRPS